MSNPRPEFDPIELLRRSDPVPASRPSVAQEARLRARIEEVMAMNQVNRRTTRPLWRRPAVQGLASLGLAVGVVVAALLIRPGGSPGGAITPTSPPASNLAAVPTPTLAPTAAPPATSPTVVAPTMVPATPVPTASDTTGPVSPGGGMAMCVESYDLATLPHRAFAFDGTVTGIAGDDVTFTINHAYKGQTGAGVTLTATGMSGSAITSAGGPLLVEGGRYLVAGDDHFAWACGFTQAWDAQVAAQWAAALK